MGNLALDPDKINQLKMYIHLHDKTEGKLMPILQKAYGLFRCLSFDVQKVIADELKIPMTDVFGLATFYTQFSLEPKGEHVIGVCMGTACYVRESARILQELSRLLHIESGQTTEDGKFTIEATRCLGCCGLAPVVMIDGQVFGRLVRDDLEGILKKY